MLNQTYLRISEPVDSNGDYLVALDHLSAELKVTSRPLFKTLISTECLSWIVTILCLKGKTKVTGGELDSYVENFSNYLSKTSRKEIKKNLALPMEDLINFHFRKMEKAG